MHRDQISEHTTNILDKLVELDRRSGEHVPADQLLGLKARGHFVFDHGFDARLEVNIDYSYKKSSLHA